MDKPDLVLDEDIATLLADMLAAKDRICDTEKRILVLRAEQMQMDRIIEFKFQFQDCGLVEP